MRNLLRDVYIRFTQAKCCSAQLSEKWVLGARGVVNVIKGYGFPPLLAWVLRQPKQSKSLQKRESRAELQRQGSREHLPQGHHLAPQRMPTRTEECLPREVGPT